MAKLVILTEGMTGRSLELGAKPITVGRTEDNAFQISAPSVSTRHCEVFLRGNDVVVKDLGSTNGTYIAGIKITEGVLKPGQYLRLGDVELKLETDSTAGTRSKQDGFTVRISSGAAKKILWVGAGAAAFILTAFVAMSLISYFRNMPGEIGWWKLDDGSGIAAKDSSRAIKGNNGKFVGDPKWVKGKKGGALRFNGNQYVSLGNIFQGSYKEISIACWIRHQRSGWQDVVERSSWGEPDGIGLCMDYSGASIDFGRYPLHPGQGFAKSSTNVQDDRWHHVVGTMRQSGSDYVYSIYVDGKLDNTWTDSVKLTATSNGWSIGARYDGTWGYQGLIDDVRIFDRALTAAEVRRLYNQ